MIHLGKVILRHPSEHRGPPLTLLPSVDVSARESTSENGTLQDWILFLLGAEGIRPTAFGPAAIGNVQGLAGVGLQQQGDVWLEVRFAFFEDGGRLMHLGLLVPGAISAPAEAVW